MKKNNTKLEKEAEEEIKDAISLDKEIDAIVAQENKEKAITDLMNLLTNPSHARTGSSK